MLNYFKEKSLSLNCKSKIITKDNINKYMLKIKILKNKSQNNLKFMIEGLL